MTSGRSDSDPLDVVYIVGKGRSGSTLLDDVLGLAPGVTSLGEVTLLWEWGLQQGHPCACGKPVRSCELWGPVVAASLRDTGRANVEAVLRTQRRALSWRSAPIALGGWLTTAGRRYADLMGRLYGHAARVSDSRVLVDSSKWPLHPGLLGHIPGIRPWVVHLVRDPRAVAYSYRRAKPGGGGPDLPRFGALHSSLSWDVRNATVEAVRSRVSPGRFMRLRYEDLASDPQAALARLQAVLPVEGLVGMVSEAGTIELPTSHLVGGNPRRFERGTVAISLDEAWRDGLPDRPRRAVEALTAPLRGRYGYVA